MLVGFSGYSQSGKDTAAAALFPRYTRRAFADALKREYAEAHGITVAELERDKEKHRPGLVELGRRRREEDPDYWIKRLDLTGLSDIVITDVRYPNEAKWVLNQGGEVIYIFRPDVHPANKEEQMSIAAILQECLFNHVIHNDGTVEELHEKVRSICYS